MTGTTVPPRQDGIKMKETIELAGIPIEIELATADHLAAYEPFMERATPLLRVCVSAQEADVLRQRCGQDGPASYWAHLLLSLKVSDALLPYGRAIFHAAAFRWRGRALLLTGESGVGKTTQYLLWKLLYGDAVQMINGDKPLLSFAGDGIWVHPSPWTGKEGMGQPIAAPLGGIVLLRQGPTDHIRRLTAEESAGPLRAQLLVSRDGSAVQQMAERLAREVPVWLLTNRGGEASARLCRAALERSLDRSGPAVQAAEVDRPGPLPSGHLTSRAICGTIQSARRASRSEK